MRAFLAICILICGCYLLQTSLAAKKKKSDKGHVIQIDNVKEYKKLLRTRKNILIAFFKTGGDIGKKLDTLIRAANQVYGIGTLSYVDCGSDKKLCKKLKIKFKKDDLIINHYENGKWHKEYDRAFVVRSLVNFMNDPHHDAPWEEDPTAKDVLHLSSEKSLQNVLSTKKKPVMVMFYAPWCRYCKMFKPRFAEVAKTLKHDAIMAGIDSDSPANYGLISRFNIVSYPTLIYFKDGKELYRYNITSDKDQARNLYEWMLNPKLIEPEKPEEEESWKDSSLDVVHLADDTFEAFITNHSSVLVMFYSKSCYYCKKMKPDYIEAAARLKKENVDGTLVAVDANENNALSEKYSIKGFPTVKYFNDGEYKYNVDYRTADEIVEFMKDPQEPMQVEQLDQEWSLFNKFMAMLNDDDYKDTLKKIKYSLVMFYTPGCEQSKKAIGDYLAASMTVSGPKYRLFAVNCNEAEKMCQEYNIQGYPSFLYFKHGKKPKSYEGDQTQTGFVGLMKSLGYKPEERPNEVKSNDDQQTESNEVENKAEVLEAGTDVAARNEKDEDTPASKSGSSLSDNAAGSSDENNEQDKDFKEEKLKNEEINKINDGSDIKSGQAKTVVSADLPVDGSQVNKDSNLSPKDDESRLDNTTDKAEDRKEKEQPNSDDKENEDSMNDEIDHKEEEKTEASNDNGKQKKPAITIFGYEQEYWLPKIFHDKFDSFIKMHNRLLIVFLSSSPEDHIKGVTLDSVARKVNKFAIDNKRPYMLAVVDCVDDYDFCLQKEVEKLPTAIYYHNGKPIVRYTGKRTPEALVDFLESPPTKSKPLGEQKVYRMDREEFLDYMDDVKIRELNMPSIDELEEIVDLSRAELQRIMLKHDEL
ncbi:Protein disulfide-isomerase A5 [Trichoplax sp. H2]|nr:Protein disulfide-isomerase A5 [Trichoplax sp. H2]|eukprot:RDD37292.1 Protein disulfide-isomerase A5 [Trichoplax sp. H2]